MISFGTIFCGTLGPCRTLVEKHQLWECCSVSEGWRDISTYWGLCQ